MYKRGATEECRAEVERGSRELRRRGEKGVGDVRRQVRGKGNEVRGETCVGEEGLWKVERR